MGVLARQRLLHLEDEIGARPYRLRVGERGAGVPVERVRKPGTDARATLDQHLVPVRHECTGAAGRERDAILLVLDLARHSDRHERECSMLADTMLSARGLPLPRRFL